MADPTFFKRPCSGIVKFADEAMAVLLRHRQVDARADESGGILLGRLIKGTEDVIVDVATAPSERDRRRRFAFLRSVPPAQLLVDRAWSASGGTRIYLGDWHSHPEEHPSPSPQDQRNWRRLLAYSRYEQDFLLFPIVGRGTIRVWEGVRDTGNLVRLRLVKRSNGTDRL